MSKDTYGLTELKAFLCEELELDPKEPLPTIIDKQITKYVLNEGFSYKEIGRAVFFYIEVKKGKYNDLYGIWFVLKFRDQSAAYWARIEREQQERRENAKKFETRGDTVVFNVQQILKNRSKPYRLEPLKFDNIVEEEGDDDNGHQ